jgi:hypothetical protein
MAGTLLALGDRVRTTLALLFLATVTACTPAQRMVTGAGITAVGLGVSSLAVDGMVGTCAQQIGGGQVCTRSTNPTPPSVGFPIVFAGLGVALLGGVVMLTADKQSASSSTAPPATAAPPLPVPIELQRADAVGMAVARITLEGVNPYSQRAQLLEMDDSQCRLKVDGQHAELTALRVRTSLDEAWVTVHACYELDGQWRLSSLGTTPGCQH